jgi:hypothetical protein
MRNGECSARATPARHIEESAFGLLLPTPTASEYGTQCGIGQEPRARLLTMARKGLIPTPTVCGNYNRKGASKASGDGLATWAAKFPTPNARDWK